MRVASASYRKTAKTVGSEFHVCSYTFLCAMYSYCCVCSVPYILFSSCQLAFSDYPDWGFSVLFLSCKANGRV
jgi:hypothetical protein